MKQSVVHLINIKPHFAALILLAQNEQGKLNKQINNGTPVEMIQDLQLTGIRIKALAQSTGLNFFNRDVHHHIKPEDAARFKRLVAMHISQITDLADSLGLFSDSYRAFAAALDETEINQSDITIH